MRGLKPRRFNLIIKASAFFMSVIWGQPQGIAPTQKSQIENAFQRCTKKPATCPAV